MERVKSVADLHKFASKFNELFMGLRRAYFTFKITKTNKDKGNKQEGIGDIVRGEVTDTLWSHHLNGTRGIGVMPIDDDGRSWFGAIDIDVYDLDLIELEAKIKTLELPLIVCRTKSGGAHLYCFTSEPVKSIDLRDKLHSWAVILGYPGVEIFPKQNTLASKNDTGSAINMPYFGGDSSTRYAIIVAKMRSMEQFLSYAFDHRISEEQLLNTNAVTLNGFEEAPPCLEILCARGIHEGERNNALFSIAVFYKKSDPENLRNKVIEANQKYCDNPYSGKEVRELTGIINSVDRKDYFYKCKDAPIKQYCNPVLCSKRQYGIDLPDAEETIEVNLGSLVKVKTDPPLWILQVDGYGIELETDEIMKQDKFIAKCMEKIHKWPNKIKARDWQRMVQDRLNNLDEQDAPDDASERGRFQFLVEQFCISKNMGVLPEDLSRGLPYTEEDKTYFRAKDLQDFLFRNQFRGLSAREMWMVVQNDMGGGKRKFQFNGTTCNAWYVEAFAVQNEPYEVPQTDDVAAEF